MKRFKKFFTFVLILNFFIFSLTNSYARSTYIDYTVGENDTFYKIASNYNLDVNEIININSNIKPENLAVGKEIKLPAKLYKIDTDISLEQLASRFNTTVKTIVKTNNLLKEKIVKGDFIKIIEGYDIDNIPSNKFEELTKDNPFKVFMFKSKDDYEGLYNSYNAERTWGPNGPVVRGHEGIDIMSDMGTPIYAVASGTIARFGWNQYGGWRINIRLDDAPYYTYYAHMSRYADGMYLGKHVKAGELIGYVGDTGYGPEGTSGKFAPHLHFGLYDLNMDSLSPFDYLVNLEKNYFNK